MMDSSFDIKFSNTDESACSVTTTSTTELVCLTSAFNAGTDLASTFNIVVVINGLTVTNTLSFTTKTDIQASQDLSPNSASPTLRTLITISLDSSFPVVLSDPADFDVKATRVDYAD